MVGNLHQTGILRLSQIEQAMAWLVESGPLVEKPPIPQKMLERLTNQHRIVRLRRGLYMVQRPDRTIPGPAATSGLVFPDGYITGLAALSHYGLTDQDPRTWVLVTPTRESPIRYGSLAMRTYSSPKLSSRAKKVISIIEKVRVTFASPEQALLDCLLTQRIAPDRTILFAALVTGIQRRSIHSKTLELAALRFKSVALARRTGYYLELAEQEVTSKLLVRAQTSHDWTPLVPGEAAVDFSSRWRLALPESAESLRRRSR